MAWFLALSMLHLATATTLNMTATLFAVIGAALFLGERGGWRLWVVLLFGFVGVLVIVRPGAELIGLGVILVFGSLVFTARNFLRQDTVGDRKDSHHRRLYGAHHERPRHCSGPSCLGGPKAWSSLSGSAS